MSHQDTLSSASRLLATLLAGLLASSSSPGLAQSPATPPSAEAEPAVTPGTTSPTSREARLATYLNGATFTGNFTLDGKEDRTPKPESYTINSCEKLPGKDLYRMKVAIKYGDTDGEFPMDLSILWSGGTPVITLDNVWIPGLGTFSSRVIVHNGRYAGTWQHDEKGGHLFGKITPKARE
ncbi:MAG: hypothetical protein AAGD07_23715 [Planctomycetota bacterium]